VRRSQYTLVCKLNFLHSCHIKRSKENVLPVTVPCTEINSSSSSVVRKCALQPRINIASWTAGYDYGLWSYPLLSSGNDNFCFSILTDPSHTRCTVWTFSRWVPPGAYVLKLLHFLSPWKRLQINWPIRNFLWLLIHAKTFLWLETSFCFLKFISIRTIYQYHVLLQIFHIFIFWCVS